jgi:hypothetical protein
MREEEKLAHDVYAALYAQWGRPIFNNISRAEAQHSAAVAAVLARYGVDDPAATLPPGVFANPALQALYDELMAQGSVSAAAALQVGILIEETDIADLEAEMAQTQQPELLTLYGNLLRGSQNHLTAFTQMAQGGTGAGAAGGNGNGPGGGRGGNRYGGSR